MIELRVFERVHASLYIKNWMKFSCIGPLRRLFTYRVTVFSRPDCKEDILEDFYCGYIQKLGKVSRFQKVPPPQAS